MKAAGMGCLFDMGSSPASSGYAAQDHPNQTAVVHQLANEDQVRDERRRETTQRPDLDDAPELVLDLLRAERGGSAQSGNEPAPAVVHFERLAGKRLCVRHQPILGTLDGGF